MFQPNAASVPRNEYTPVSQGELDRCLSEFKLFGVAAGFTMLLPLLAQRRQASRDWVKDCAFVQGHPLHEYLLNDPYTARAFHKPRGYAGDAELIDLVYDQEALGDNGSLGRELLAYTTSAANARAVRHRRALAAAELQVTLKRGGSACALACGHLREAEGISATLMRKLTAVDQDAVSLSRVGKRFPSVRTVHTNVLQYLRAEQRRFDLIYALGLLDYLSHKQASLLLKLAAARLNIGGKIFVANFTTDNDDVAYMEAATDWWLTLRDEAEMTALALNVKLSSSAYRDCTGNIVFMTLTSGELA